MRNPAAILVSNSVRFFCEVKMNEKFFIEALKEADLSLESNDVPIGAVIVSRETLISKGHNSKILLNDPTAHAEALAIRKACSERKDWRLADCDLYVTLKPCPMCLAIIKEAHIEHVYYLLDRLDYKKQFKRTNVRSFCFENSDILTKKYQEKLSNFFKENCKR